MMVGGQATALAFPLTNCVVPSGVDGIVYIYITKDGQPLANDPTIRDNSSVVAGPTGAFIDSKPQTIAALVRTPSNNAAAGSAQTTTINPAAATTLASAAATTTGSAVQTPPAAALTTPPAAAGPATVLGTTTVEATPAAQATPPPVANVGGTSAPAPAGPASVLGLQPPNPAK